MSTDDNFLRETRAVAQSNRSPPAYQPNILLLRQIFKTVLLVAFSGTLADNGSPAARHTTSLLHYYYYTTTTTTISTIIYGIPSRKSPERLQKAQGYAHFTPPPFPPPPPHTHTFSKGESNRRDVTGPMGRNEIKHTTHIQQFLTDSSRLINFDVLKTRKHDCECCHFVCTCEVTNTAGMSCETEYPTRHEPVFFCSSLVECLRASISKKKKITPTLSLSEPKLQSL